jgi:hypothetical protein
VEFFDRDRGDDGDEPGFDAGGAVGPLGFVEVVFAVQGGERVGCGREVGAGSEDPGECVTDGLGAGPGPVFTVEVRPA